MSYKEGIEGEQFFIAQLNEKGLIYEFIDSWYDFEVQGTKVEVKTCTLTISNGDHRQLGIYEFTSKENRENLFKENVWICLIVKHNDQFIIQGFVQAKLLDQKQHISIIAASRLKMINLDKFIKKINS